ncbi:response regulator transcription factor [Streptomyces sp. NPDC005180]|uniref:response regulator transcription factor n=1 Tax=Streptomyces sp. NPDC005180 TaxID=3156868 RepID=UPI0033BABA62
MTISVVIADGQDAVRTGFRTTLDHRPGIEVLADAADGRTALAAVAAHRPDVLLLGLRTPGPDALDVTRRLSGEDSPRVVLVTASAPDPYVHAALHGGACGFLLQDAGPAALVEAVRAAAAGDALVSPAPTVRLLRELAPRMAGRHPAPPLTAREQDLVRCVARGLTDTEIGAALDLPLPAVRNHLAAVQAKLTARNRVEIAAWAWETGLAATPD